MIEVCVDFRACDTAWRIQAKGARAAVAVERAVARVRELETLLDAFAPSSAVARLNREGVVVDATVALLVRRAEAYRTRTGGAFDIGHGGWEHAIKSYIRGETPAVGSRSARARYVVEGDTVTTDAPIDLNGIAKGFIVDEAWAVLAHHEVEGFVDGGGDIARPTGPVAIASPYHEGAWLGILDTRWNIATSGSAKRKRGDVEHLYDPRVGRTRARHDQVTVISERDCEEADILATTLAVMPLREGKALMRSWQGAEAMWVDAGRLIMTAGFDEHVRAT